MGRFMNNDWPLAVIFIALCIFCGFIFWAKKAYPQTISSPYCAGLTWDPNSETDVKEYCVYRLHEDGSRTPLHCVQGRTTTFVTCEEAGLTALGKHTVCLTAKDFNGNESACSESVLTIHRPKAQLVADFPEPPPEPNIELAVTEVGSHFTSNNFPTVQPFALEVGARVYTDRNYTIVSVPDEYIGTTYIQTPNNDKTASGFPMLWFTMNRDAQVCIARDTRLSAIPNWMDGFMEQTLDTIKTTDAELQLYCQGFSFGLVELGGNESGTIQSSNYLVVVR